MQPASTSSTASRLWMCSKLLSAKCSMIFSVYRLYVSASSGYPLWDSLLSSGLLSAKPFGYILYISVERLMTLCFNTLHNIRREAISPTKIPHQLTQELKSAQLLCTNIKTNRFWSHLRSLYCMEGKHWQTENPIDSLRSQQTFQQLIEFETYLLFSL